MAEDLKAAFDGLDKEGKGSINKDQLAEFLSKHEKEAGKGKEIAEVRVMALFQVSLSLQKQVPPALSEKVQNTKWFSFG